jgi:AraC family transcriptional regulator
LKDDQQILLKFRDRRQTGVERRTLAWRGLAAEYISIPGPREYAFNWVGSRHYLALHDLKLNAGETTVEDLPPSRLLDRRDRMTFIPQGCRISGWSEVESRSNAFTAVYYDAAIVREELEGRRAAGDGRPMLYFENPGLRATLTKIQSLLTDLLPVDPTYAETLGLLAAIEIHRLQEAGVSTHIPDSGQLSARQERLIRDYIAENLHRNLSLSGLAELAGLSRFHFTRSFKKTMGLPPHQFILHRRVECSKRMLVGNMPMREIAESLGFAGQGHFSSAFRRYTGYTPTQFRRLNR